MFDVNQLLREQGLMESQRSGFDSLWQQAAKLLFPRQADFNRGTMGFSQGDRRTDDIVDEYPQLALDHGVAVFEGEVIPQGGTWQRFTARDENLMKNQRVRLFFERLTDRVFALRNSPYSGFGNQTHESAASLLAFGNQAMWADKITDRATGRAIGIGYRSDYIGQLFIREDHWGRVVIVHRKFAMSHRQACEKWGDKAPECAVKGMRDQRPEDKVEYLHVIRPNPNQEPGRLDAAGKPIASAYISLADRQMFDVGGYRSMPLIYSRYEKSPNEDYGRGPGLTVLPAVMALQEMMADIMTATEFMARPMLGVADDMQDQILFYEPGGVSYGAIDARGNPMAKPIFEGGEIQQALVLQERTRQVIDRAFFADLYTARQDLKSHVSATDVMDRAQQRGVLLAPLARQQTEWFTPLAERELDIGQDLGIMDDAPPELMEAGGLYQIIYENPLTRARKADGASGFYQLLQGVSPLMQQDPTLYADFKRAYSFPRVLSGLAFVHAVPASWETTDDEKAAIDEQVEAKSKAASLLDVGTQAAGIAKDLAQAGAAHAAA